MPALLLMKGKITLQDIADKLGVSKTVVSWVLSGQGDSKHISKETQTRILEKARELNFTPNYLARSLNTGNTHTLGLIFPSISDPFYASIARHVSIYANKRGYTLMVGSSRSDGNMEDALIRMMRNKKVDGIMLATMKRSRVEIDRMIEDNFPFVLYDRYYPELDSNYVIIQNEETSYQLTKHLISKGLKNIAFFMANAHLTTIHQRYLGYKRALNEAGLEPNPELVVSINISTYMDDFAAAMKYIHDSKIPVDGYVFSSALFVLEAVEFFKSHGMDIQNGRHIACFHASRELKYIVPEMSSAKIPTDKMGIHLVDIMVDDLSLRKSGADVIHYVHEELPCELELN